MQSVVNPLPCGLMTTAERGTPSTQLTTTRFFAEPLRDYVLQCLGRPVSLLQAGCLAPLRERGRARRRGRQAGRRVR